MDPYLKSAPDLQCGAAESVASDLVQCMRFRGHYGMHAAEPSPGETMTWPNTLESTMAGILNPYGLKPDAPTTSSTRPATTRGAKHAATRSSRP